MCIILNRTHIYHGSKRDSLTNNADVDDIQNEGEGEGGVIRKYNVRRTILIYVIFGKYLLIIETRLS